MIPLIRSRRFRTVVAVFAVVLIAGFVVSHGANAWFRVHPDLGGIQVNDSRITSVTLSSNSATPGATATWTVTFVTSESVATPAGYLRMEVRTNCWEEACKPNFTGASGSGIDANFEFPPAGEILIGLNSTLAAGSHTITLTNVVNPTVSGAYKVIIQSHEVGDPDPGEGEQPMTPSNPIFIGSVVAYGTVTMPDETTPVPNVGINLRNADSSVRLNSGTDSNGFWAIGAPQGGLANGTYFIDVFPPNGVQGITAPDPYQLTYSGTVRNTGVIAFVAATKTLTVRVKYNITGQPAVTTASVWSNKRGGAYGGGADVNGQGVATLSLSGGSYDVGIGPMWDQQNQTQMEVDWAYSQPPMTVEFANNTTVETKTVTFLVTKATATIKGKVVMPNGSAAAHINMNCNSGNGGGMGTQTGNNGRFSFAVPAGDYTCDIWIDPNDQSMAQLAAPDLSASVADGQTFDFGTITLVAKEGRIKGRVVNADGAGVAGVNVNAWVANGKGGWNQTRSGADGSYTMYVKGPAEYEVRVEQGPDSQYIYTGQALRASLTAANTTVTGLNFEVVQPNAEVNIRTVDANGDALTQIWGYAFCFKKNEQRGPGSEYGSGINQGSATINLVVDGPTPLTCGMFLDPSSGLLLKETQDVTISEGDSPSVQLELVAPDATVRVTVVDQDGNRIRNAGEGIELNMVKVVGDGGNGKGDMGGQNFVNARLNNDGTASFRVQGGAKYNIGYWIRPGTSVSSQYLMSPPQTSPFNVAVNGTVSRALTIKKANTSISGTLVGPDGHARSGFVHCGNWGQMEDTIKGEFDGGNLVETGVEVGSNGRFSVPIVAGNTYDCGAGVPQFMKESENLMPPEMATNLTPTKAKPITGLEMQFKTPDHMMSVSVANEDGTKPYFGWCHGWSEQGGNTGGEAFNGSAEIPFTSGSWRVGCENYNQETGDFWRSDEQSVTITPGTSSMSFVLKKSNFEPPQSTTATFDCTVAQTISLDDGTSVAIPANALATEGNCTVTASPTVNMNYSSESKPAIGYGYDLTALDGSNQVITGNFNSAVTLTIQAPTDAELAEIGLTLDDIIPKFFDESSQTWQNVAGSNVDQELNQYSIQMTHFTVLSLNTGATTGVGGGAKTIVVSPKASGGPQVTTWNGSGARQSSTMAYATTFRGGVTSVMGDLDGDGSNEIVTAPASAGGAHIRVFDADGNLKASLFPYTASFRGGLSLALGNLDDDAALELIVAPQIGGGPHVRSFDYADGAFTVHSQFFSHPVGLRSGVSVKTGDTNGDRTDDIIVSTNTGAAPHVRSFNGEGQLIGQFMAFPVAFRGGVNVTVADVNGDGKEDIVVSPKSAGGPQVRVLRPNGTLISQFYAFPSNWRLGLVTAVGDLDANGANEIVVAPQSGGSHVRYFNANGQLLGNYVAPYPVAYRGGLELAVGNVASEDPNDEIVVAPRLGGGPHVIVYDIVSASDTQFMALHPQFRGGVNLSLSQ